MAFPALLVLVPLLAGPPASSPSVQTEASAPGAPTYETRLADGQLFQVGTTPGHEVWLAWGAVPRLGRNGGMEPALVVIVGNAGGEAVPFDPSSVRVWERTSRGDKPMDTLSVEQVESKRRTRKSMLTSVQNPPQRAYVPPVAPVVGFAPSTPDSRPIQPPPRNVAQNADGARVPLPAPKPEGRLPDNAAADRVAPMGSGAPATLWAMRSTLMRPGIVERGTYYGGLIYLEKARLVPLRVEVKIGSDMFRFDLAP